MDDARYRIKVRFGYDVMHSCGERDRQLIRLRYPEADGQGVLRVCVYAQDTLAL